VCYYQKQKDQKFRKEKQGVFPLCISTKESLLHCFGIPSAPDLTFVFAFCYSSNSRRKSSSCIDSSESALLQLQFKQAKGADVANAVFTCLNKSSSFA